MYFVDPYRSEPIQISSNGVNPISGKMSKYFKNTLKNTYDRNLKIIGYYNIYNKEYIITTETNDGSVNQLIFNSSNWDFLEAYTVNPATLAIVSSPTKGTLSAISGGLVTYSSTPGSTGTDTFSYSFTPVGGSTPITKNICIGILPGSTEIFNFSLGSVSGQNFSVYSNPSAPVGGLGNTAPVAISIVGGQYRINGGTWVTSSGLFYPSDQVEVRVFTSSLELTATSATLTIGSKSAVFIATTKSGEPISYSYSVSLGTTTTNVCTATPITVYSGSSSWGTEMFLYANSDLTGFIGDFGYAVEPGTNNIWSLTNDGSAPLIVYFDTALDCSVSTDVTITACGTNPDISNFVTLYAYSNTAVDTNVSVEIQWVGSLSTVLTGTAVITAGNSIGSITVGTVPPGENYSSLEILSITPSSSSTQNYVEGSVSGGTCPT
jgi:hypothetical protein